MGSKGMNSINSITSKEVSNQTWQNKLKLGSLAEKLKEISEGETGVTLAELEILGLQFSTYPYSGYNYKIVGLGDINQDNQGTRIIVDDYTQTIKAYGLLELEGRLEASQGITVPSNSLFQGPLVTNTPVPANSSSSGTVGAIAFDLNYIYMCVAVNTWKRSPLTTW